MKRALLPVVATLLAALVTAGSTAAVAHAAPDRKGGAKAAISKVDRKGGGKAITKVERKLAGEQPALVSLISSKDRALARAVQTVNRAGLAVGQTEVLASIAADRAALEVLRSAATAATTLGELRTLSDQVHQVRPAVYSVVVNGLRQAAAFQTYVPTNAAAIAEVGTLADAKLAEGFDVTAVRTLLAEATAANDEALPLAGTAIIKGLRLTSTSTSEERAAFSTDVAAAGDRLDIVEARLQLAVDALAAMVPAEEPVVTEPIV